MAKTKQITEQEISGLNYTKEIISLDLIVESPLKSQERRRARFKQNDLEELAASIKRHGILQFPTVRKLSTGNYELVFGERRITAGRLAGLTQTECIIRELTDEQSAEMQLIENIQRKDLHPIDEAFSYDDLKSSLKCDEREISLRTGKDLTYVKNCLLLLKLDETVMKLFEEGQMEFQHALEFAKYPSAQKELLNYCFNNYGYDSQSLRPYSKFVESIKKHHLLQLKKAPFSTKSTELHPKGLACIECPSRTSAEPLLFKENFGKEDSCLDRACWNQKTDIHVQIQRKLIAETRFGAEKAEKKIKDIPLITKEYYLRDSEKPKDPHFTSSKWHEIKTQNDHCEFAEDAVFFNGDRIGQTQLICKNPKCKKHLGKYSTSSSSNPEKESEDRKIRKEEIFDVKVGEAVRKRVLTKCAVIFGGNYKAASATEQGLTRDLFIETLKRMWFFQASQDDKTESVICEIIGNWVNETVPSANRWNYENSKSYLTPFLEKISEDIYPRILFLFLHAYKGAMFYGNWASQKEIKSLAELYEIDYQKLDAEERLGHAAMKNKDVFRDYLEQIEAGNRDAKIPRLWSTKWKPKE